MNGMTPEQQAMLGAIIDQRKKSYVDIFEYDPEKTLDYLNKTGAVLKYKLGLHEQSKILDQLVEQLNLIKMDYVVDTIFDGEFKSCQPKWKYESDWAHRDVQLNGLQPIEDYSGKIFINMTLDEAHELDFRYIQKHAAKLVFDNNYEYYYVELLSNKPHKKYYFSPLQIGTPRWNVIKYAIQHRGDTIHKKDLVDMKLMPKNKALKSQVFDNNTTITEVLKPFISLTGDTIQIITSKKLTSSELEIIKQAAN